VHEADVVQCTSHQLAGGVLVGFPEAPHKSLIGRDRVVPAFQMGQEEALGPYGRCSLFA